MVVLVDLHHFGAKLYERLDLAIDRLRDAVHAAGRLEHRLAHLVVVIGDEVFPQAGIDQRFRIDRRRRFGLGHQTATRIDLVAAAAVDRVRGDVAVLLVEHAPAAHRREHLLPVLAGQLGV